MLFVIEKFFVAVVKLNLIREQRAGTGCINEVSGWQPLEPPRATGSGMKRVERNEEEKEESRGLDKSAREKEMPWGENEGRQTCGRGFEKTDR